MTLQHPSSGPAQWDAVVPPVARRDRQQTLTRMAIPSITTTHTVTFDISLGAPSYLVETGQEELDTPGQTRTRQQK